MGLAVSLRTDFDGERLRLLHDLKLSAITRSLPFFRERSGKFFNLNTPIRVSVSRTFA